MSKYYWNIWYHNTCNAWSFYSIALAIEIVVFDDSCVFCTSCNFMWCKRDVYVSLQFHCLPGLVQSITLRYKQHIDVYLFHTSKFISHFIRRLENGNAVLQRDSVIAMPNSDKKELLCRYIVLQRSHSSIGAIGINAQISNFELTKHTHICQLSQVVFVVLTTDTLL